MPEPSGPEGEASPDVDVALAAFANEYRLVKDWTAAGSDTAAACTPASWAKTRRSWR